MYWILTSAGPQPRRKAQRGLGWASASLKRQGHVLKGEGFVESLECPFGEKHPSFVVDETSVSPDGQVPRGFSVSKKKGAHGHLIRFLEEE